MNEIFCFLVCLAATLAGGISGVGGGVIIKPVLDAVSGMPVSTISFLSGCTVLSMTAVSVYKSRNGEIKLDGRRGTILAIGGAAGGIAGKQVFEIIRAAGGRTVGILQQAMMILLTVGVLLYTLNKARIRTLDVKHPLGCLLIGVLLGVVSSFLGIGGGPINLAVLYYFFSMDSKTAALHSLYVILFSQTASLLTTCFKQQIPEFDVLVLCVMVLGGVLGGNFGRSLSKKMKNEEIDRLFRGLLWVIIAISVYNFWNAL